MASEALQKVIEIIRSRPPAPEGDIPRMRAEMEQVSERVPADVLCEPVQVGAVMGEWIVPPNAAGERVVLYLHGGGYVMGSIRTHRATIARIARASGARALALNYRLAPEYPFPRALEDAADGYRWLLDQGCPPRKIAFAGDSAGGGLALATLVALRDAGDPLPAAGAALSPWTDLAMTGASLAANESRDPLVRAEELVFMAQAYLGGADPRAPLASPLYADLRGLPPLLLQVGEAEILRDDAVRVAARARAAGVKVELEVWDEVIHVWHLFAKLLPEGLRAIDRIGRFLSTWSA